MNLYGSRWFSQVSLVGSTVTGLFSADLLRAYSADVSYAVFESGVALSYVKLNGPLFADHTRFDGDVTLNGAEVGADLQMSGTSFKGRINASRLNVKGSLILTDAQVDGDVNLVEAQLGTLEMGGSSFAGTMRADTISVEGNVFTVNGVFLSNGALFGGKVILAGAKIDGSLIMTGSTAWQVILSDAEIREELSLEKLSWWCAGARPVSAGSLGSSTEVLLKGSWRLGDHRWRNVHCDGSDRPLLSLRDTHVKEFQDSIDAWPPSVDLEGFRYDQLGGENGALYGDEMRRRSRREWVDWLARDQTYSSQPYTQLSFVLTTAGQRDTAASVQIAGREREREEACAQWSSPRSCVWLTFLSYGAGYGIGLNTFIVLIWVIGFTVFGADVLWCSAKARRQGYWWRFFASLHQLTPIGGLGQEFTNFFTNSSPEQDEQPNLSPCQILYFAGHSIIGWVLGFLLVAAMSEIIQK
jgi:hypothetical protein